ncbi:MAG: hypothetical protein U9N32_05030 [Spirochaetota bacterium]|nr:hypothetical protein [Spirochaetota bacterium]
MKKNKIPGIFRKQYKIKVFNSKIIKRIHIPKDQEIIKKLFVKNSHGKMEIIQNIPEDILLRLKPLSKSIKKNKGMVSRWKLIIVLILVASILIFNLIFKDKLLTKGVESGLEKIFQADVEVDGLHFSILKGSISFRSLIIVDADNSNRNLLETGPSEFRISIAELIKKRVKIEEMSLTGFLLDTPRVSSSDIDEYSENSLSAENNENDSTSGGVLEVLSPAKGEYESILQQQKDNLSSIDVITMGNEETNKLIEKWKVIYSEKDRDIKELEGDFLALKSVSIKDIHSVEESVAITQDLTGMYSEITNEKDELILLKKEFQKDKAAVEAIQDEIDKAIKEDYAYLENLVDLSTGDMGSLVSDTAETYIRNRWNTYYENALKAFEVYEKFKDREIVESQSKKGIKRDSGRIISFLTPDKPVFVAEHILISGGEDISGSFSAEIRALTNEPDKLTDPLTFSAAWGGGGTSIFLDGFWDMRSETVMPFSMEIGSSGNYVTLDEGISFLNISSLSTIAGINGTSITQEDRKAIFTILDISLTELDVHQIEKEGFLSKALTDTFANTEKIDIRAEILINRNGMEKIKVSSDFDTILSDSVGAYLDDMTKGMGAELEKSLSNYLSPYLVDNEVLESSLTELDLQSIDQISSANDLEDKTDSLIKEQKDEAAKLKSAAEEKIQDKAVKLLDQATDKLKLPGF